MSANLLFADLLREVDRRIKAALRDWRPDLTKTTGVLPGYALPTTGPAAPGDTGTGYPPAPHSTDWSDVTGTPTTLSGYGITDAASDAELAAHEADTTSVHGIADTSLLLDTGDLTASHNHTSAGADGGVLTNDAHDGYSEYAEISAPSTPAGNTVRLYARDKSGVAELFYKNDAGTERDLSSTGGGGSALTVEEVDGSPTDSAVTKIKFPNGTLAIASHEATYTPTGMDNPMTTQDDLIVGGVAGAPARLAKGTDGQVLTVDPSTHHLVWATPASSYSDPLTTRGDLVKRGASSTTRLAIGASGKILTSDGTDPAWGDGPLTTKGDMIAGGASGAISRLGVGSDNAVLIADSSQTLGVRWGSVGSTSGANAISATAVGSEPGSPATGDLDLYTNGFVAARYSGSAWAQWGPLFPLAAPPTSGWSWVNQGSATVTTTNGGIVIYDPTVDGSVNYRVRTRTAPSTPYTITALLLATITAKNFSGVGIGFRQSSDGKMHLLRNIFVSGWQLDSTKITNATTDLAAYTSLQFSGWTYPIWLRIQDNGTNRICSFSMDGVNYLVLHTVGRTDHLTADEVCFWAAARNGSFGCYANLVSWAVT